MTDQREAIVETKYGKIEGDFKDGLYVYGRKELQYHYR